MDMIVLFSIVALLTSIIATFFSISFFNKKNLFVQKPNNRSSHSTPTPSGGGIIFFLISWTIITIFLFFLDNPEFIRVSFLVLLPIPVFARSLIDDFKEVSAKTRLIIQIISAILAIFFIQKISNISIDIFFTIIAILIIVWMTNLYNFIDGINGYAAFGASITLMALFFYTNESSFIILAFAIFGFLIFNIKGLIFMGDSGSATLGFMFGLLMVYFFTIGNYKALVCEIILLAPFIFDATYTLIKRFLRGENILKPHKEHIFQKLAVKWNSHFAVTLMLFAYQLLVLIAARLFL